MDKGNLVARWSCFDLKMSFLDLVTIEWDGFFGRGEHKGKSKCMEGDKPKVYKTSWLDGGEDSVV